MTNISPPKGPLWRWFSFFQAGICWLLLSRRVYIGLSPLPVRVTTRIITFLVGNPYKPSFPLLLGGGTTQGIYDYDLILRPKSFFFETIHRSAMKNKQDFYGAQDATVKSVFFGRCLCCFPKPLSNPFKESLKCFPPHPKKNISIWPSKEINTKHSMFRMTDFQ